MGFQRLRTAWKAFKNIFNRKPKERKRVVETSNAATATDISIPDVDYNTTDAYHNPDQQKALAKTKAESLKERIDQVDMRAEITRLTKVFDEKEECLARLEEEMKRMKKINNAIADAKNHATRETGDPEPVFGCAHIDPPQLCQRNSLTNGPLTTEAGSSKEHSIEQKSASSWSLESAIASILEEPIDLPDLPERIVTPTSKLREVFVISEPKVCSMELSLTSTSEKPSAKKQSSFHSITASEEAFILGEPEDEPLLGKPRTPSKTHEVIPTEKETLLKREPSDWSITSAIQYILEEPIVKKQPNRSKKSIVTSTLRQFQEPAIESAMTATLDKAMAKKEASFHSLTLSEEEFILGEPIASDECSTQSTKSEMACAKKEPNLRKEIKWSLPTEVDDILKEPTSKTVASNCYTNSEVPFLPEETKLEATNHVFLNRPKTRRGRVSECVSQDSPCHLAGQSLTSRMTFLPGDTKDKADNQVYLNRPKTRRGRMSESDSQNSPCQFTGQCNASRTITLDGKTIWRKEPWRSTSSAVTANAHHNLRSQHNRPSDINPTSRRGINYGQQSRDNRPNEVSDFHSKPVALRPQIKVPHCKRKMLNEGDVSSQNELHDAFGPRHSSVKTLNEPTGMNIQRARPVRLDTTSRSCVGSSQSITYGTRNAMGGKVVRVIFDPGRKKTN